MNAFAKSFELSSCAAARVGPKMGRSASRNASTMPAASGASGPTTVSAMSESRANGTSSAMSVIGTLASASSRAVPALPGATNTRATRGLCAIFHASACSLPPPPTTRMFIARRFRDRRQVSAEVADAGEHHREAALVGGRDHFSVAHAAARLDHRRGAVVGDHVEAVAKRKERVGSDRGARERELRARRLHRRDARRVDAAHLAGADAERLPVAAVHDRVRLHELGHAPHEHEVAQLVGRRRHAW